jgi:hypothetical protein
MKAWLLQPDSVLDMVGATCSALPPFAIVASKVSLLCVRQL